MDILVHSCCGPCYIHPARIIGQKFNAPVAFFFNPNIHPYAEHEKRLDVLKAYTQEKQHDLYILKCDGSEYLRYVYQTSASDQAELEDGELMISEASAEINEHDNVRCRRCYEYRLDKTAKTAKKFGAKAFTTTLLVSPYQDHESLIRISNDVAARHNVEFYYEDFRDGYKESVEISRFAGMYRQKYCGCRASLVEREAAKKRKKP